jgi:hypothetical protein
MMRQIDTIRRGLLAGLILAGLAGWATSPVAAHPPSDPRPPAPAAQPAGLAMSAEGGYDSHYKLGEWFPVRVNLVNTGAAVEGDVEVGAIGDNGQAVATYVHPISLPSPSRKTVTLYTYAVGYQHDLTVRLTHNGSVLAEQKIKLDPLNDPFLLGVVSDTPDLLNSLSGARLGNNTLINPNGPSSSGGQGTPATVAHLALADLPTSAPALAALDVLVFAATDSGKLTPEQRAAIAGWVAGGGTLVVAGGANPAAAAGLADLLPAQMEAGQAAGDLSGLGNYVKTAAPESQGALASTLRLRTDIPGVSSLIEGAGGPLLARRAMGSGEVFALALDPTNAPLKTWDKAGDFWKALFATHQTGQSLGAMRRTQNSYQSQRYYGPSSWYLGQLSPFDVPGLQLPSIPLIGGFLFLYVLAIGPLNYFILRRRRQLEWSWLTIPLLIGLFAVGAYAIGFGSKGNQLRLTTGTLVQTYAGSPVATVAHFAGLFSPSRRAYNIQWDADAALSEVAEGGSSNKPARLGSGQPTIAHDVQIDTWALRGFLAETSLPYAAPFEGTLQLQGSQVTGRITNRGKESLHDVAAVLGDEVRLIGTLAPGASAEIKLSTSGTYSSNPDYVLGKLLPGLKLNSYPRATDPAERMRERKAALLNMALAVNDGNAVTITGWADRPPLTASVPGETPVRDDLTLVTMLLPWDVAQGQVTLGAAMLPPILVNSNGQPTGEPFQPNGMEIGDDTILQYHVPSGIMVDAVKLDYNIQYGDRVKPQLYNWSSSTWEDARDQAGTALDYPASFSGNIADPAMYINDEGILHLRLLPDNGANSYVQFTRFSLSMEGRRP